MTNAIQPFHPLVIALAGRLNRRQQAVTDYLNEENRVFKDQIEGQRLWFTDSQRQQKKKSTLFIKSGCPGPAKVSSHACTAIDGTIADPGRESGLCHRPIYRGNGLWHH